MKTGGAGNQKIFLKQKGRGNIIESGIFGIDDPEISGLTGIDGNGVLSGNSTGSVAFTMIPTSRAALEDPTVYQIGGTLRYTENEENIDIPLAEIPVVVVPQAELSLHYFHQRDVFGDDPFTDPVEISVPFALGLIVENKGAGDANNLSITSGQPQIVENEKGLLIDFELIGTQVG